MSAETRTDDGAATGIGATDLRTFPWVPTALLGGLGALTGYVLVVAAFVFGPATMATGRGLAYRLVEYAFVFYNAHLVDVVAVATVGGTTQPVLRANILVQSAGSASPPVAVYFAIPVVVLLAVGAHVGYRLADPSDLAQVAYAGAGVAVGYGLLVLLGRFLASRSIELASQSSTTGSASAAPDLLQAGVAGFAFPVVFASLGALVGVALRRRSVVGE